MNTTRSRIEHEKPLPSLVADRSRPIIAVTMGDPAGIGPEIAARAWADPTLHALCCPVVIGSAEVLRRHVDRSTSVRVVKLGEPIHASPDVLLCLEGSPVSVADLPTGRMHPRAGRASYDYLCTAIDLAMAGEFDAIVTLPIQKEGLHAAGLDYPGHTEILAERTATRRYAMMLYRKGLGVAHVTLHRALRDVFAAITTDAIVEKIGLLSEMMFRLGVARPAIAVAALNPHASDGGLFGDEESRVIRPAVERARATGLNVTGPLPADTLFVRASGGEFDGVVAMYHDQGHIGLKLLGWREAVNITLGLPIIRTSVAHGTGYDIAGKGKADPTSFFEAVRLARLLWQSRSREESRDN
jgi:4-hydroxythreonine-4-phosphate dehydrogenase